VWVCVGGWVHRLTDADVCVCVRVQSVRGQAAETTDDDAYEVRHRRLEYAEKKLQRRDRELARFEVCATAPLSPPQVHNLCIVERKENKVRTHARTHAL
jgi:hypothetical protein